MSTTVAPARRAAGNGAGHRIGPSRPGSALLLIVPVAVVLAGLAGPGGASAAGSSRFASYDAEPDCVAAHAFAPSVCHVAFANARSEYEAKTPSFASLALCTRRYASCMAWPPGTRAAAASFRPRWDGVDIVDTPSEHSVTPSPGSTGQAIRFAARPLVAEPAPLVIRRATVPASSRGVGESPPGGARLSPAVAQRAGAAPERASPPGAPPPPGSGFRLEDGVLTYPAPARFQPRNLPTP